MLSLEDSPAFFRTASTTSPQAADAVQLQNYTIDYGVIDAQLKEAARRRGTPATLEFAAAATMSMATTQQHLNDGLVSGKSNKDSSRQRPKADAFFHAIQELEVPPAPAISASPSATS